MKKTGYKKDNVNYFGTIENFFTLYVSLIYKPNVFKHIYKVFVTIFIPNTLSGRPNNYKNISSLKFHSFLPIIF